MLQTAKSVRSLLPLGLGFLFLFLSAVGAFFFSQLRESAYEDVRGTLQIESQLNSIQTFVTDAETGQRGYLLTGRIAYLDPFQHARQGLGSELDMLGKQIGSDSGQQERLARLRGLITKKLTELQDTVDLRGSGRIDDALATVNSDAGAALMTEIRDLISAMRDSSRHSLELKRERAVTLYRGSQITLVLSVVSVLVLGLFALRDTLGRIRDLQRSNLSLLNEATERKAAENQVPQLQKMEAMGQLTGGIAHDFNNMLAIIFGSLNLAKKRLNRNDLAGVGGFIDNAFEGAERAATLTQRLLAFSRLQPLAPKVLEANQLVSGMSELLRRTLGEHIRIETILAAGLWRIHVDPVQLENAIVNLAVNARDAMPDGGILTIETCNTEIDEVYAKAHSEVAAGHYSLISITDTGTGMSPDIIERAFDPFYTTKTAGKGTGLGLSQVFGFVKQSRGHVKIYSERGHGTTVKVYLPRYTGEVAAEEPAIRSDSFPEGSVKEVILVVEDDAAVRTVTVNALRELGYTVIHAGSPLRALEMIGAEAEIALVLTDIVMPDMNGRQMADKALELEPNLKFLFTTGYTRNAIVHNGMLDPGTAFLAKPFTIEQLARKVRDGIDR